MNWRFTLRRAQDPLLVTATPMAGPIGPLMNADKAHSPTPFVVLSAGMSGRGALMASGTDGLKDGSPR